MMTSAARAFCLGACALVAATSMTVALAGCGPTQSSPQGEGDSQVVEPSGQGDADDAPATASSFIAEGNGYTIEVFDLTIDENGCGMASFSLTNPDGLLGTLGASGEFVPEDGASSGLDAVQLRVGAEGAANARYAIDETATTDTALGGTVCFDARGPEALSDGLSWVLTWHEGEGDDYAGFEGTADAFIPESVASSTALSDETGATGSLSALGVVINAGVNPEEGQFVDGRVSLQLTGGSEVVVYGDEGATSATQSARADGSSSYAFAEKIDPAAVASVTLEGTRLGADGAEQAETHVFKPSV